MKQINQIGKYTKKQDRLDGKRGRTFITPKNRSYVFDYLKEGSKYTYIICYKDFRYQISEQEWKQNDIDGVLDNIINTYE